MRALAAALQGGNRMLVFRSLAIGLSAACFALLVMRPPIELRTCDPPPAVEPPRTTPMQAPTIIDAAPGITPLQLAMTLRLGPGEHVVAVDDVEVGNDISAGVALASRERRAGQFIDVAVAGPAGERRILVVLH